MKYLLPPLLFLFLLSTCASAATLDPSFRFSTMETVHFSIHYHQGLEEIANRAAALAEEAHDRLSRQFDWNPREKTQLILIDNSDFANGWATAIPYNTILLQIVPPSYASTIGEYDDWLKILITHEYTHIMTSDPARGYSRVMRNIFGKPLPGLDIVSLAAFISTAPPNIFLPKWWHEGTATWGETEFSTAGRGRSSYYEMITRMAVAEDNIPSIDKINGDIPYWPGGSSPYIFGLNLYRYIAEKYGTVSLGELNLAHAGRYPYALNGAPEYLLAGKDYPALYAEMAGDLKSRQGGIIQMLQSVPLTPVKVIYDRGENLTNPRISPDGRLLAFNLDDPHEHPAIVITAADGQAQIAKIPRLPSDQGITWSPDSRAIYYSQAEIRNGFNVYQDLYRYDLESGKARRLSRGLRINEPDLSPDGKRFAAVVNDRGSQYLTIFDAKTILEGDHPPLLRLTGYQQSRISGPRWSPDSKAVAFTVTDNLGHNELHLYDTLGGQDQTLLSVKGTIAFPTWARDGSRLAYTSTETGVPNLFSYSFASKEKSQLSHLLGGAFQPEMAGDGKSIIFASYGSRGFKIARLELTEAPAGLHSPSIPPYWKERAEPAAGEKPAVKADSHPYSPLPTILPHFWLPKIMGDEGGTAIGAYTAGQDVLGYNSYLAEVAVSNSHHGAYFDLTYQNDYLYPTLSARAYRLPALYSNLLQRGDYYELQQGLVLQITVPINRLESQYRFHLGYSLLRQTALSPMRNGTFNGVNVFEGRHDNIFAGVDFLNSLKYPYSISPEQGRQLSLLYRRYSRLLGSELSSSDLIASYEEYLKAPQMLGEHQVLYYKFKGGVSTGERTAQQSFQLGGVPSEAVEFPLRGYPSRFETGKYVATATVEYRLPLWYLLRGFGSKPFFLDRLHGAAFVDLGEAWDDQHAFNSSKLKVGAGIEARMDVTLGYWLKLTPAVGYAHGFKNGGTDQVYLAIYANL